MAVLAQQQVAGKAGPQADRIDPEIGQVRQVNRIAQDQVIAVGRRIEQLPKATAAWEQPSAVSMVTSFD